MTNHQNRALRVREKFVSSAKRLATQLTWIALSLLAPSAALAEDTSDTNFHDIQLSCPNANGGTLELVRGNKLGQRDRITIIYDGSLATKVEAAAAERSSDFETYFRSENPETEIDPVTKEFADTVLAKTGMMRRGVCLAPENERQRYFRMINRQREYLGIP